MDAKGSEMRAPSMISHLEPEASIKKDLEQDHPYTYVAATIPEHHYPPPPLPSPPPAAPIFRAYDPPPRRSGIFVPTPILILFVLVFLFESSVLFVYTALALFKTLPVQMLPMASQANLCGSGATLSQGALIGGAEYHTPAAPQSQATVFSTIDHAVTIFVTASSPPTLTTQTTSSTTSTSADADVSAIISAFESHSFATVTSVPTVTSITTVSSLPSVVTETVLSTAEPVRPTVTSIAFVTGS